MCKMVQYKQSAENLGAFEAAAMLHLKALFRVAMYLKRDRGKAESLVQETCTQALQSFHHFEPGTNWCAWLVAIMYSVERRRPCKFRRCTEP